MVTSPLSTLLLIAAAAAIVSVTSSPSPSLAQAPSSSAMLEPAKLFFFSPPGDILPKIEKCWSSIVKVEGCAADLLLSSKHLHVNIGRDCCDAVVSIGGDCFVAVFTNFPFSPLFPPLLEAFCDAIFSGGRNCSKISPPPHA